jgi:hypothetical protein
MIFPYEIQDGEVIEHNMSFEMQLNALNKKSDKVKEFESVKIPDVFKTCSCGNVFKSVGFISICETCYNKFDNHKHYLAVMKRIKGKK